MTRSRWAVSHTCITNLQGFTIPSRVEWVTVGYKQNAETEINSALPGVEHPNNLVGGLESVEVRTKDKEPHFRNKSAACKRHRILRQRFLHPEGGNTPRGSNTWVFVPDLFCILHRGSIMPMRE